MASIATEKLTVSNSIARPVRTETENIPVLGDRIEITNDGTELKAKASLILPDFRLGISFGVFF